MVEGVVFPIEEMMAIEKAKGLPWAARMAMYRYSIKPHATIPQELADAWTEVMTEAVRALHEEGYEMQPAMDYIDDLTDEQVDKRIANYQVGYDKEYDRRARTQGGWSDLEPDSEGGYAKLRYRFADMPRAVQRAVVSHWDRIHHEYLAAHPDVHYLPSVGYFWLIDDCIIKMFEVVDGETPPTEAECLNWEKMNAPGGLSGYLIIQATREAGEMEPMYTAYGDFMD